VKCLICGKREALESKSMCQVCRHERQALSKEKRPPLPFSVAELRKRKPAIDSPKRLRFKQEPEGFVDWNNTAIYC